MADEPALLRAHPGLRARLPRVALLDGPTPVEPLALAGGAGQLFVKRDERSCPLYGGNKPRKLEFLLGAARAAGSRRVITTGGIGTHHGLATTILAREVGLDTSLVLVHQPVTEEVKRTLLLLEAWGAELAYGGNVPGAALQGVRVLLRSMLRGQHPAVIPTGGSSPVGNLGFVSAALELAEQVRAGLCPEPVATYVAVGTGGTLAGLVAGLALAGLRTRVVGVLVTDILPPSARGLRRDAERVLARLRRLAPDLPPAAIDPDAFELVAGQLGERYGAPTGAARAAVAAAREAGLELETTYTGKCLAEVLERSARGRLERGPVLFWNTYNAIDPAARAPSPLDAARLPPRLRRFLDTPAV